MAKKITPTFSSGGFPVVPHTPTGIYTGFDGSKYERAIAPGESVENVLAQEQGTLDVIGNIAGRFVGRATLSAAETFGMLGYGSIAAIRDGKFSSLYENELSQVFKKADEALVKNTPFYDTEAEKKAKFFSSDIGTVLGSAGFWGNALGEGGGFVAGAMLGGMGTGLALKGLGALGKTALTATRVSKAVTAATEAEQLASLATEVGKDANFANKVKGVLTSNKFKNAAQFQTQRAVSNMYEAGVEARGVREEYIANMEKDFKLQYGEDAVADQFTRNEWEKEANKYANTAFGINMALLNIDGIGYSRYFRGYKETRKAIDATRDAATGMYKPLTGISKGISLVKNYGGNAFAESFQEAGQFLTEKTLTDRELQSSQRGFGDYIQATIKGLEETFGSKEGQESMVIGAMLGGPSSVANGIEQGKLNKMGVELLNKYMAKESIAPIIQHTNDAIQTNKGDLSERVAESSSKYLFRSAQDEAFYNYVNSRIQSGRFGDLMDDLDDFKRMDEGTFNELFATSYDRVKKDQTVQELINSAKRIQDITDKTDAVYGKNPFRAEIIKTVSDAATYDKRIREIQTKLTSEENPLEREILMSDLGFLVKDREKANEKLAALTSIAAAQEKLEDKKKNEKAEKEVEKAEKEKPEVKAETNPTNNPTEKGSVVIVDGKKVVVEGELPDGTIRGATPQGPVIFDPDERDAGAIGIEKTEHYDEEFQDPDPEKVSLGRDTLDRPSSGNFTGQSFVFDPTDPNSEYGNWTDFQPKLNSDFFDYKVENGKKTTPLEKTNADKSREVVDGLIDNMKRIGETHRFEVRDENGKKNLYAIEKTGGKETHIGYFLNRNTKPGNSSKQSKVNHGTIDKFVDSYSQTEQGQRKQVPNKEGRNVFMDVINGWRKLIDRKVTDITKHLKLRSEIISGDAPVSLAEIMNSPYSKRWQLNGEYVIVQNDNGNYAAIDSVNNRANIDLIQEALSKPNVAASLGTQYAILVKRPDSDNYQFIGLKGADLPTSEKQKYIEQVTKINADPKAFDRTEVAELVNTLNKNIFLATNKTVKVGQEDIPIHIRFYHTKTNKIAVIAAPKLGLDGKPIGVTFDLRTAFGTFTSPENAISSLAKRRIYKASEEAQDEDFLKDYLVTNVSPAIWKTYFRFEHKDFLDENTNQVSEKYTAGEQEFPANSENLYNVGDNVIWNGAPHTIAKIVPGERFTFYTLADANGNIVKSKNQERLFPATQLTPAKKTTTVVTPVVVPTTFDAEKYSVDLYYAKLLGKPVNERNKPLEKGKQYLRIITNDSNVATGGAEIITGTGELYKYTMMSGYAGAGTSRSQEIELPSFYDSKGNLFEGSLSAGRIYEIPNIDISNKELLAQLLLSSNYIKNKPITARVGLVNNNDGTSTLKYYDLNFNVKRKVIETFRGPYPEKWVNNFLKKEYDAELAALRAQPEVVTPTAPVSSFSSLNRTQKEEYILNKINSFKGHPLDLSYGLTGEELKFYNENKAAIDELAMFGSKSDATLGDFGLDENQPDIDPSLDDFDIPSGLGDPTTKKPTFKPIMDNSNLEEISDEVAKEIENFTGIKVEFYKEGNTQNYGEFRDGIIYLNRFVPKGTQWHEAFHGIFSLLPEAEQDRLLRIAGNKWGVTNEEFMDLIKIYEDRGHANFLKTVGKDWIVKTILEEKIADHFQEFMVEGKKPVILESFFTKAKKLVNLMGGIVEEPSFEAFFRDATKGKFKQKTVVGTQPKVVDAKYKVIPGSRTESESTQLVKELIHMYSDRHNPVLLENFPELEGASNTLQGFVRYYINILRKYANQGAIVEARRLKEILESPLTTEGNKVIAQEQYNNFRSLIERTFVKENGLVFPAIFATSNIKMITEEVIRVGNFKETYEEVDPENEKDTMHNESVQSRNPITETSTRDLANMISGLYYFDLNRPVFLDERGIINNLLFTLSNEDPENYEDILAKLAKIESNSIDKSHFAKSMEQVYNMYTTNETFKNIFNTAFDKRFTLSFQMVDTVRTRDKGAKVITVNKKDHVFNQMNLWKNEGFGKQIDQSIKENRDMGKALGITIQDDVYTDPEAQPIFDKLYKIIKGSLEDKDFNKVFSTEKNRAVLEELAAINLTKRLDIGELNYKNANDKTQYSIINNSFLLEKLAKIYLPELDTRSDKKKAEDKGNPPNLRFGTFSGSEFGDNAYTYSDLDPRSLLYTTFNIYNNSYAKSDGTKEFTPYFFIQQFESKSTNFIFQGYNYAANPIEDTLKYLNAEVDRQAIRINQTLDALEKVAESQLIDGYHTVEDPEGNLSPREYTLSLVERFRKDDITRDQLPRGFQYTNLPYANEKTISQNPITEEDFERMLSKQTENMNEYFKDFNLDKMKFLKEITNNSKLTEKEADKFLRNFLINQYMNRSRVLSQVSPNLAQFKGYVDITKRGAGLLASGPNHGEGTFKFGVIKDIDIEGANSTDAAGFESISERINRYIRQGVISPTDKSTSGVSDRKHENYLLLKAYLEDDRDYIDAHQDDDALLKIDKTVGYGEEYYIKTAVATLTRYATSQVAEEGDTITINDKSYTAVKDEVNGKYYLPLPSTVDSWKMLNEMQQPDGPQAIFAESAIKKNVNSKVDVTSEGFVGNTLSFNYKDYRLQQENPSGKEKIKDGTQLLQLIDAYFSREISKGVSREMDVLVSEIKQYGYEFFGKELVATVDGVTHDPFMEYVKAAMQSSALSDRIMEFFETDPVTGTMKISPNMPMIKNKFEQYVMSYYNNNIASHKVPGNKCTLLTSLTKGVITYNGDTISTYEYNNLSKEEKQKCSTRRLAWPTEEKPYAEVIVSEEYINQMGFKISEWNALKKDDPALFEKLSTAVAYRIPTQAQHSMMAIKIVDVLPASYGSTIIAPAEITKISGADYDVDSLYIHKPSVFHTVENGKKKFKLFGEDPYSFEKSIGTNKIVKEIASNLNIEEKERISAQIVNLRKNKYSFSKQLSDLRSANANIKEASPAEKDKYYAEKDSLIEELQAINNDITYQKDLLEEVNRRSSTEAITLIRDKENPDRRAILTGYLKDYKNPDGTKTVNSIIPESNFNRLLELRMQLLTSPEGVRLINTPAKDFMKEIYSGNKSENKPAYFLEAGYPNSKKEAEKYVVYSGQDTMLNEYRKISTGSKAIGGAANINKVAAFLQKNGVSLNSGLVARLKSLYANLEYDTSSELEQDFDFIMQDGKIGFITKTENVLKFNTLSNMVSITVDNAKDQTLVLFNITDSNISEISTMAMLGMGINRISAILQTPAARKISSLLSVPSKSIYEYQEFRDNPKVIEEFMQSLAAKGAQEITLTDADLVDSISTWDDNKRIENLMGEKDFSNLSDEDKHRMNVQYTVASLYNEVSKITKDAYQINTLLNFNKNIGKEGFEIDKLLSAHENIGGEEFSFNSSNITSNVFIEGVNDISTKLSNKIGNKLISYHKNTSSLTSSILRSTDKEGNDYLSKKFQASLNKEFIDFLGINIFFSKHKERNVLGGMDLYSDDIVTGKALTEAYEKVKNKLGAFVIGKMFEEKPQTSKYPFKRIGIDTFENLSPAQEQSIVDSFDMMVYSEDPDIQNFAYQVLAHIAVHDNYRYLQGSVVSKIRAEYFGTYNSMYTEYVEPIIRELKESDLSTEELRDIQWLKQRGINVPEPKTVRQKLVYHTNYDNYTSLIGNFAKYFFSDNRNARHIKDLENSKFLYKPQEQDFVELTPFASDKDTYVVEVDPSVNPYEIISPLVFSTVKDNKKSIFVKEGYESKVESLTENKIPVNRIVYKKLKVVNNGNLPSAMMRQYPYNVFKEKAENAIKTLPKEESRGFTGAAYSDILPEEPEYRQGAFDNIPERYDPYGEFGDFNDDPYGGAETQKEDNAVSNPNTQSLYKIKTYEGKIETLKPNQVFVFGSNPEGRHGLGSAQIAKNKFGAKQFQGRGLQGQSYGLVTKNLTPGFTEPSTGITYPASGERSVSPQQIVENIDELYQTAINNPTKEFLVAYGVDKNLNGYSPQEMANMFSSLSIPSNIVFNKEFSNLLSQQNSIPTVSAEENFNNPEADADALIKAQEARKQAEKEDEELKAIAKDMEKKFGKFKPIAETNLENDVINEISSNFEQYKDLLGNIGINSVEELMDLSPERKSTLIMDICKG